MEPRAPRPELSIVVPAFNEVESLPALLRELRAAIAATGRTHELIVIDDGSTDGTAAWLRAEVPRDRALVPMVLLKNSGQSAANPLLSKIHDR